jgi:TolB-like protein
MAAMAPRTSTLGSAVLVISAMLVVVSLTVGGVVLMSRKQAPRSVAATSGRPTVAVMAFENRTGDPRYNWYGSATAELLGVVLAQLPNLDVISKQRIYDVLRELKVKVEEPAQVARAATEAAKRSGARLMIRGDTLLLSGSVILTAEVVEVGTGRVLGAERVTAVNEENMLERVDELGRLLSERLKVLK